MARAVDGELQSAIDALQTKVDNDPDIQALLRDQAAQIKATHDKGGDARTYQKQLRDQVTEMARAKGYIPEGGQYFINPNDGQLEPHGGWSGLSNTTRAAIIAAAGVATWGAAGFAGTGALAPSIGGGGGFAGTSAAAGMSPIAPTVAGGIGAGTIAAGSGGVLSTIGSQLRNNAGSIMGAAGNAFGAGANAAAHNRGVQFDADIARAQLAQRAEQDYFNNLLNREDEGRKQQRDAWEMSNRAAYVQNAPASTDNKHLSPYSKPIAGPSAEQRTNATGVFENMSTRLREGNSIPMPVRVGPPASAGDATVQDPGWLEKWGGMAAPVLNIAGRVINRGDPTPAASPMSATPQVVRRPPISFYDPNNPFGY